MPELTQETKEVVEKLEQCRTAVRRLWGGIAPTELENVMDHAISQLKVLDQTVIEQEDEFMSLTNGQSGGRGRRRGGD